MSNSNEKKDNVVQFRGNTQFHIGIFICIIIFIYVLFRLLSYVTAETITIYEVKDGSIVSDHNYRGLIIRQEETVKADMSGYVYYFASSGGRVGVRSPIYAVDETGSIVNDLLSKTNKKKKISGDYFSLTQNTMATFVNEYSDLEFQKTYIFKDHLTDALSAMQVDVVMEKHKDEIDKAQSEHTYHAYYASRPGIVSYMIDGLEAVTVNDFDPDIFNKSVEETNVKSYTQIKSGDPAYKLITSDDWNLVIPIDSSFRNELGPERHVELVFEPDGNSAWASVSYSERDDVLFLVLSMDDSMERYSDLRFVNVEIMLDEKNGLKIPNSAIVKKPFFIVPKDFFLQGENSTEMGVLVKGSDGNSEFVTPTIYKETKHTCFIDDEVVHNGDTLVAPDSVNTYTVGSKTKNLSGVYSANKGYAVFKRIEPIQRNEDYTIIRPDTPFGIALYDHIVLQGDKVEENQIIY